MIIHKSKQIVLVSHCVMNQNTVVDGLQRSPGAFHLARLLIDSGAGILQLPCPEFFMINLERPGMSYEEYNTPEYRAISQRLIEPVLWQVEQYLQFGYEIIGLIGIQHSPNCSLSGQVGVFMDELMEAFLTRDIAMRTFEVSPSYGLDPAEDERVHKNLLKFLEG